MFNVVVILTCFNRKEKTLNCIKSLIEGNQNIEFNFVIVDDCSTDGTMEVLKKLPYQLNILSGNGSLYWAGGMRLGIRYVLENEKEYDYILFVNDDVDFFKNIVQDLITQENRKNAIIVGATCDMNNEFTYGGVKMLGGKKKGYYTSVQPAFMNKCDTFNMNCVLVSKQVFIALGNFDEKYKHSLADLDYGLRASRNGYEIFSSNKFVGICLKNPIKGTWQDVSLSRIERIRRKESVKNAPFKPWFYFLRKHYGIFHALRYSITPYIRILIGK